jgi:hypothetical protein
MSWLEDLESKEFTITTGDGKVFKPLWKNSEKSKEYNATVFDFIDVAGSFVDRKKPKSTKYPLTFWFQGEDNISQAKEFDVSADDPRSWTVEHPFYGIIKGQPLSINYSDTNYNVTEVSVDFWESINDDYPDSNVSEIDRIAEISNEVADNAVSSYASKSQNLESSDITKNKEFNILTNASFKKDLLGDNFADYQVLFSSAQKANNDLLTDAAAAVRGCNNLITFPSTLNTSVLSKLKTYLEAFNNFNSVLSSTSDKLFFESQAGLVVAFYCNTSMNYQPTDYEIRTDVELAVNDLINIYNTYLTTLDDNYVNIYNVENSWQPNPDLQQSIYNAVMFTISNLYNLAFNSKQERSFNTKKDENLIVLTHRLIGLDPSDENINKFREINNIKLNELFKIPKGRLIKYYV